jgi:uncharacterized protein YceH (UPF0502 family)
MSPLDPIEVRVLGVLIEKSLATPETYPLSLNALVTGCNQKTNREPVMDLSERDAAQAIARLIRMGLAGTSGGAGSRVEKYRHALAEKMGLDESRQAALAVLLLRGLQTAGEVRQRSGRLYASSSVAEAEGTLDSLEERDEPLATRLPVQPGRSAARYAHLLSGEPEVDESDAPSPVAAPAVEQARATEDRLVALEQEVAELKAAFEAFKRQFE